MKSGSSLDLCQSVCLIAGFKLAMDSDLGKTVNGESNEYRVHTNKKVSDIRTCKNRGFTGTLANDNLQTHYPSTKHPLYTNYQFMYPCGYIWSGCVSWLWVCVLKRCMWWVCELAMGKYGMYRCTLTFCWCEYLISTKRMPCWPFTVENLITRIP